MISRTLAAAIFLNEVRELQHAKIMIESEYTEPVSDLPRPILQINSYQEQTTLKCLPSQTNSSSG